MSTILQQGKYTSTGVRKLLSIRSDVDWMNLYNFTQASTSQTPGRLVEAYWQRGMAPGTGLVNLKLNGANTITRQAILEQGFTLIDSSSNPVGALDSTITAINAFAHPVVTVASTTKLVDGDVVRIINVVGAQQLGGYDFTIDVFNTTTFELSFMAQIVAGTTGSFRKIAFDPLFYPTHRSIARISQEITANIEMTVAHGFTIGQRVRMQVPAAFGMTEMDNLDGTIQAISQSVISVDIDSTGFTPFVFPLTAALPFTPALVVPIGMGSQESTVNLLDDATRNLGIIGMEIGPGIVGADQDVMYWAAGKSFSNTIG